MLSLGAVLKVIITGKDDLTFFAEYLGIGVLVCVHACVGVSGGLAFCITLPNPATWALSEALCGIRRASPGT